MMKRVFLIAAALLSCASLKAQEQYQTVNLTLEEAIEIALNENPTIKIADMEIQRQDYVRKETIGNLLPSLSASGQYSYAVVKQTMGKSGISFGADNTVTLGANLNLPLFVPAVYATLKMNKAQMADAIESARASKINMVNEVQKAYYNILLLDESLNTLYASEKISQESVDNIRRMFNAQLTSEYDLMTAEVNLSNIKPTIIQTVGSLEVAKMYIRMLLSLPENVEITLAGNLNSYSDTISNSNTDYSTDISRNSDVLKLDIQSDMLKSQIRQINSQRIPTLAAFGQYSVYGNDMGDFNFNPGAAIATDKSFIWQQPANIGISLSVPIFAGNKINSQIKQTRIAQQQLDMQKDYVSESTTTQVQTAISNLMTAKSKMEANMNSTKQAKKAYTITNARYTGGAGTILELNSALLQVTQAELNYNQAIYDYLSAQADYDKIVGKDYVIAQTKEVESAN